jgi:Cd2+/Zn2+-exporting ATPase
MEALHSAGIKHITVLTGDHRATAEQVGRTLGVDAVRADLLPTDKANAIQELQTIYGPIAMVGDGVNDAPALATADIGIAMGVAGTDTALETADIALMADDLTKLPYTIRLSRAALRLIKMNIVIALAIKALAIALIFPGWLTLWLAVLADMGASIIVTLNGLRLVRGVREPQTTGALCHDDCCCGDCHHDHDSHHADEHGHSHCLDGCCHGH